MITIICGVPGAGKTALLTHFLNTYAFDKELNNKRKKELAAYEIEPLKHCIYSNYNITFKKHNYFNRYAHQINPFRLGFLNEYVQTHYIEPYSIIGITEGQTYFNSRKSKDYPAWQSRWYEAHRHHDLTIYIDVQRAALIDLNIRELSAVVEVQDLKIKYDKNGQIKKIVWTVRFFENYAAYDTYSINGKIDKKYYDEQKIVANYNVFELYRSKELRYRFYENKNCGYPLQNDIEIPKNFYGVKYG